MPPSVRDYNQMAPFWDFIAGLEEQGSTHPFFANFTNNNDDNGAQDAYDEHQRGNPWSQGWGDFPFGAMAHRGRHGHHGPPPPGPPPPGPPPGHEHDRHGSHGPGPRGPPPPPGFEHGGPGAFGFGPHGPPPPHGHEHGGPGAFGSGPHGPPPPHGKEHGPHGRGSRGPPGHEHGGPGAFGPGPHGPPPPHGPEHGKHGHHGRGPRGPSPPPGHDDDDENMTPASGDENDPEEVVLGSDGEPQVNEKKRGPGGRHHGHHGRRAHDGPRCGGRGRGGWGGRGRGGPFGGHHGAGNPMAGGFGALAAMFQDQLFGQDATTTHDQKAKDGEDFKPEVDVFDTPESFVVHISLPGAKKSDLGVHWDAEKSELNISGVIHRPGDEELLKTLALDERKVGAFARKVRLGSRTNPAQVDAEGISAKLEDGILRVDVPKQDSGYVEIKKVDIE